MSGSSSSGAFAAQPKSVPKAMARFAAPPSHGMVWRHGALGPYDGDSSGPVGYTMTKDGPQSSKARGKIAMKEHEAKTTRLEDEPKKPEEELKDKCSGEEAKQKPEEELKDKCMDEAKQKPELKDKYGDEAKPEEGLQVQGTVQLPTFDLIVDDMQLAMEEWVWLGNESGLR